MPGTNYRVDRVAKQPAGTRYEVPASKNGLIYLSYDPPSLHSIMEGLVWELGNDEVLLISKWEPTSTIRMVPGSYVITEVVTRN